MAWPISATMERMLSTLPCVLVVVVSHTHAPPLRFDLVGRHSTGLFDRSAAEVPAFHAGSKRLFVVNASHGMDIIDISDASAPRRVSSVAQPGTTSVAVHGDIIALAAMGSDPLTKGTVRFFDPHGGDLGRVTVGYGPDMVAFTQDGRLLLVACEGEAPQAADGDTGVFDPPGSISLVDLSDGVGSAKVIDLGFEAFEAQRDVLLERGLRVVTPGRTLAEDLEPEYISISPDGRHAFVTLQENNAIAVVDLAERRVRSIEPLGFRDCSQPGMGIDAVVDGAGNPQPVPLLALFQPDSIVAFDHAGETWLVTANEGEAREGSFTEAISWREATKALLGAEPLQGESPPWGDVIVSRVPAPASLGGRFCVFGSRSVSLWRFDPHTSRITHAWDSGDQIERIIAKETPRLFNVDHRSGPKIDARSRSKGPEPEGLALGTIAGRRIVFVALERTGGVMALDVTDPARPSFVGRFESRDPEVDLSIDADGDGVPDHWASAGDLGPEALAFIPASASPSGEDLLVVCYEVSGTTAILRVRNVTSPAEAGAPPAHR